MAAKTKIAAPVARDLMSWEIGNNLNQIATIRGLRWGKNNKGTLQVRVAVTAGRTANGNVNWFYAEAIGKVAEKFANYQESDRVKLYSTHVVSEYVNKFGEVEFFESDKILYVEAA
jgi:hypothetical protein